MQRSRISVIGSGWLGLPLARHLADRGHVVTATTTSTDRLAAIRAAGVAPHRLEVGRDVEGDDLEVVFTCDALIVTMPPSGATDYPAAARSLARLAAVHGARHLLFTSSTSVYPGLCRVVTEDDAGASSPAGLRRNGAAVLEAEREFAAGGVPATIMRLAGLYGHGRHPARYLSGRTDLPAGDAPVNLVHRDDVIAVLEAVVNAGPDLGGEAFNVVSSRHPSRRDVYTAECARLALPPPVFRDGRGDDWKEVSGAKLEQALGFSYRYPDPLEPAP